MHSRSHRTMCTPSGCPIGSSTACNSNSQHQHVSQGQAAVKGQCPQRRESGADRSKVGGLFTCDACAQDHLVCGLMAQHTGWSKLASADLLCATEHTVQRALFTPGYHNTNLAFHPQAFLYGGKAMRESREGGGAAHTRHQTPYSCILSKSIHAKW